MLADLKIKPVFMARDGVRLAHFETGPANPESPPLVLVNGWTGDHGIFTPQIIHFARNHRVVAINLRGHGASDAPKQEYTIVGFADDIAWQCAQLGLKKPLIIGHSLGGVVTLELCGRYPDLASGMMMIDSIVMAPPNVRDAPAVHRLLDGIGGPNYLAVSRANAWEIGCDYDDPVRRKAIYNKYILPPCEETPQHRRRTGTRLSLPCCAAPAWYAPPKRRKAGHGRRARSSSLPAAIGLRPGSCGRNFSSSSRTSSLS
jgi:pimeloyl-ACP methyl ester carboxylesterase